MFTLGARARFSLVTNVNTPFNFFQLITPEFGHSARARVQDLDLIVEH